ncbi:uncharacterized protein [Palaemon carinicauda]|uniref:uncharacterized protein n=1 Tax=Palaemon carinicauda TaxID=392227 RepID=UPI0035B60AB2
MVTDERDFRRPYQFWECFSRHNRQDNQHQLEQTLRDRQQIPCWTRVICEAMMRYNVALASTVPWAIAIFILIQLGETFLAGILIISFACYSGWLVAKIVHFIQNYQIQHRDDEREAPTTPEPPPYEIVVAKPPAYNELYDLSILAPGHSHGHVSVLSPQSNTMHELIVPSNFIGEREWVTCVRCKTPTQAVKDNQGGLPTYDQAVTMMARGSAVYH